MKSQVILASPPREYDANDQAQMRRAIAAEDLRNVKSNDYATTLVAGIVKAGTGLTVANDGTLAAVAYTEGTWTPTDASGASLTFTVISAIWARLGNLIFVRCQITYPATASGANATIGGFPVAMPANGSVCLAAHSTSANGPDAVETAASATTGVLVKNSGVCTNANVSGATLVFSGTYSTV